jgi:hypothetical protein
LSHILEFKEQKSRQTLFHVCRLSFALFACDADKLFHTPGRVKSFAEVFSKGSSSKRNSLLRRRQSGKFSYPVFLNR